MRKFELYSAVAALLVAGVSCKSEDKPDAFVKAAIKAVDGQPQAIWNALPPSYHKDVQELLTAFGGQMNEQVWNDGFAVGQKAVKVLETKQEFVVGLPQLKGMVKPDDVTKGWTPAVHVLSTIVNSDLKTLEGVKKLDMEKFLGGPVASVMDDLIKVAEVAGKSMPTPKEAKDLGAMRAKFKSAKVTVEKSDANSATVKIEVEGEPVETQEMVKVEGKWIPKDLADAWPGVIAKAKASIALVKIEPQMVAQFNAMKGMIDPVLDALLAAKTQEEFNAQIEGVTKALGGPPKAVAQAEPGADSAPAAAPTEPPKAMTKAELKAELKKQKKLQQQQKRRH